MANQPHSAAMPPDSAPLSRAGDRVTEKSAAGNGAAEKTGAGDGPLREAAFARPGVPVITGVNRIGMMTLYMKEVRRFFKVQTQTIWAPAVTTLLFLVIFTVAMGRGGRIVLGVNFATFVAPGLIAMGMMQNAFANASFALLAGKLQGTIVDLLMPPLTCAEMMFALLAGSMTRALLVGLALAAAMLCWPGVSLGVAHPWAVVWFGLNGAAMLALIGLLASIWAEKFDHNAAVTNFVIQPMSLLSGTFYVIDNLSPVFRTVSRFNPFFYVISGFRFGFLGRSDLGGTNLAVLQGAAVLGAINLALGLTTYAVLRSGWRLKG